MLTDNRISRRAQTLYINRWAMGIRRTIPFGAFPYRNAAYCAFTFTASILAFIPLGDGLVGEPGMVLACWHAPCILQKLCQPLSFVR
jgi:hypothetical protein